VNGVAEALSADKASELAAEQQRLRDIIVFASKNYGRGLAELRDIIAAPALKSLAVDDQFQALTLAAAAAMPTETALAHGYLDRAIALPGIEFEDQLRGCAACVFVRIDCRKTVGSGRLLPRY
jgi:hypothetical protein